MGKIIKFLKISLLFLLAFQNNNSNGCCTKEVIQGNLNVACDENVDGNLNTSNINGNLIVNGNLTALNGQFNNLTINNNLTVCGQISDCNGNVFYPGSITDTVEYLTTTNGFPSGVINPNIKYTEISQYYYPTGLITGLTGTIFQLPLYSLSGSLTGGIKYIALENNKVAPSEIKTDRGSFVLNANQPVTLNPQTGPASYSGGVGVLATGGTQYSLNKNFAALIYTMDHWKKMPINEGPNVFSWFVDKQQGSKLVGTGASGGVTSQQGNSVSLSADGNTLAVGGPNDNGQLGATWSFTRSGSTWSQLGPKLVGTGNNSSAPLQGNSVSLSADGNTLAIGGPFDLSGGYNVGFTWIFTKSGSTWSQQDKLRGSGFSAGSNVFQGQSVSLSADGKTLAIGGNGDSNNIGATWIFTKFGSNWVQQGNKLVGTGTIPASPSQQGISVSLSADGNTLAVGGPNDNANIGATWIFTRQGSTWTQQGLKLVGSGYTGIPVNQGRAVSLSADGNTLAVGGISNNGNLGAVWIFTRSGSIWTQQGLKLVGLGYDKSSGTVFQGNSVSLSADGNTLAVGGYRDAANRGAVWIWTRLGITWTQQTNKLVGAGGSATPFQGVSVSLSADGNTLAFGGSLDNPQGATWIFV